MTDNKRGVDDYSWSPDGTRIAFIAQDAPLNAEAIKAHNKVFRVTNGHFLLTEEVAPWHLWVTPAAGGKSCSPDLGRIQPRHRPWRRDHACLEPRRENASRSRSFRTCIGHRRFIPVIAEVSVESGAMRTLVFRADLRASRVRAGGTPSRSHARVAVIRTMATPCT